MRFLAEAVRDPINAGKLLSRSESALIAAVGLDPSRRDRAAELLADQFLGAEHGAPAHRANLAMLALEIQDRPGPAALQFAEIVSEALDADVPRSMRSGWIDHLCDGLDRLEPKIVTHMLAEHLMEYPADFQPIDGGSAPIIDRLASVAKHADPIDVDRIAWMLSSALVRHKSDREICAVLTTALASIANRMTPGVANQVCDQATRNLMEDLLRDKAPWVETWKILKRCADRISSTEAVAVRGLVSRVLDRGTGEAKFRDPVGDSFVGPADGPRGADESNRRE